MSFRPAAAIGMPLAEVDTPCLMLELDEFERNLKRLPDSLHGRSIRLRPHAKSHKCPEIALRQIALGAAGVCVQKVSEAEALIAGGVKDILIANEVVGAAKVKLLAELNKRAHVAVCADDAGNVTTLDAAARAAGVKLEVLVEVDVGAGRCGVPLDLAEEGSGARGELPREFVDGADVGESAQGDDDGWAERARASCRNASADEAGVASLGKDWHACLDAGDNDLYDLLCRAWPDDSEA